MEIASVSRGSVLIKGKNVTLFVNPSGKHDGNASILLRDNQAESLVTEKDGVIIASPGEYEIGGIKIRGNSIDHRIIYTLSFENTTALIGTLSSLEKIHAKLSEHDIVLVDSDVVLDPSFLSSVASRVILFAGDMAGEVVERYIKDNAVRKSKYSLQKDKLPQEGLTVLLQ